jgi:hypothetical protein
MGLDTNHGFAKTAVENSEVTKRRTPLEQRLARLKQWIQSASKRGDAASRRRERLLTAYKTRSKGLYQELWKYQLTLEAQDLPEYVFRQKMKERKAELARWTSALVHHADNPLHSCCTGIAHSLIQMSGYEAIIATTNVGHLSRFIQARVWQDIP